MKPIRRRHENRAASDCLGSSCPRDGDRPCRRGRTVSDDETDLPPAGARDDRNPLVTNSRHSSRRSLCQPLRCTRSSLPGRPRHRLRRSVSADRRGGLTSHLHLPMMGCPDQDARAANRDVRTLRLRWPMDGQPVSRRRSLGTTMSTDPDATAVITPRDVDLGPAQSNGIRPSRETMCAHGSIVLGLRLAMTPRSSAGRVAALEAEAPRRQAGRRAPRRARPLVRAARAEPVRSENSVEVSRPTEWSRSK